MKYDNLKRDLSFQYNKIIKEYGDQDKIPRIYCDLDGTLCDFVAQLRIITGKSIPEWENYLEKQLREWYGKTKKVLAFNLLYSEKTKIEQIRKYFDINEVSENW